VTADRHRTTPTRSSRRRAAVTVGRVYDRDTGSAERILVDRLWPRGVAKADAAFDVWLKDVAPSTELRRWYSHDVSRHPEFARRYRAELDDNEALDELVERCRSHPVVLLTATRDLAHSGAQVLAEVVGRRLRHTA
jgi:uncharacterized protein YeaO (DUF488 family)